MREIVNKIQRTAPYEGVFFMNSPPMNSEIK